jgi:hypothetical protein
MAPTRIRIANNPADVAAVPEKVLLKIAVIRMGFGQAGLANAR